MANLSRLAIPWLLRARDVSAMVALCAVVSVTIPWLSGCYVWCLVPLVPITGQVRNFASLSQVAVRPEASHELLTVFGALWHFRLAGCPSNAVS